VFADQLLHQQEDVDGGEDDGDEASMAIVTEPSKL